MLLVTLVSVTERLRTREIPKDRLVLNWIIIPKGGWIKKRTHWREWKNYIVRFLEKQECH